MSGAGAIGIDLGSHSCVIAAVKGGGVEILTNDLSNRQTPSVVGFGDKQRFIGESGFSKLSTNFRNTVLFPTRFLGLSSNYQYLHDESKWLTNKLVTLEDGRIAHEVRYLGENMAFTSERIVAMFLTQIKIICQKTGLNPQDVVISVPCYFTETERRALLDAIAISDLTCARIMNDSTASALSYGLFRSSEFTETPRVVALTDLGHSKFTVSIVQFTKDKLQVLTHVTDRNLGGRDLDWKIMEFFASSFEKKHGINLLHNHRARSKMSIAVEKLRKMLSANTEAVLNLEYIVEDLDLHGVMTRDEFETLAAGHLERIDELCKTALRKAGVESVHSVEILGGGTRIPCVQRVIAKAFNVENVSKTLNPEEAIARGCAVQSAMLSPLFKVKEFSVQDIVTIPISIKVSSLDMEVEVEPEVIFPEKNVFPTTKIMKLRKNQPFKMNLFYPEPLIEGLDHTVADYGVICPAEGVENEVKVYVKMNGHGVVNLEKAELIEEIIETEEIKPEEAKAEEQKAGEEKKEPSVKRKYKRTNLEISKVSKGLKEEELKMFINEERRMTNEDRIAKETSDKRNEVEAYVYEARSKLNSSLQGFVSPSKLQEILAFLSDTENWVYGDGADTLKSVYTERLDKMREQVEPVIRRSNIFNSYPQLINELQDALIWSRQQALSPQEQFSHITEEERNRIIEKAAEFESWLQAAKIQIDSMVRHEDPTISTEDFVKKTIQIREVTNQTMSKPKPAPPAPPKEEKKEEAKQPEQTPPEAPKNEEAKKPEDMELD
ncbi:unnamed protein product [Blepharisma stoltei]|uniref:Uncharacterized protein n=1 Tax=Blepharisma stoltei TaxID=1481888 RepID=A0AAU9JTP9_9CILI|nr:unnamed protein product [Blepharisma stoltei]